MIQLKPNKSECYYEVDDIPIIKKKKSNGEEAALAYAPSGSYDFPIHQLFKVGNRICRQEYDDLVKLADAKSELQQLTKSPKRTSKDETKINRINDYIENYREKQVSGYYLRLRLAEELKELESDPKKTATINARILEIRNYLKRNEANK